MPATRYPLHIQYTCVRCDHFMHSNLTTPTYSAQKTHSKCKFVSEIKLCGDGRRERNISIFLHSPPPHNVNLVRISCTYNMNISFSQRRNGSELSESAQSVLWFSAFIRANSSKIDDDDDSIPTILEINYKIVHWCFQPFAGTRHILSAPRWDNLISHAMFRLVEKLKLATNF